MDRKTQVNGHKKSTQLSDIENSRERASQLQSNRKQI
jgi:hypothetical protein